MQYMGHTCTIFIYLTVTFLYVQSMQLYITCLNVYLKKKNTQNKDYRSTTAFALLIFVVTKAVILLNITTNYKYLNNFYFNLKIYSIYS